MRTSKRILALNLALILLLPLLPATSLAAVIETFPKGSTSIFTPTSDGFYEFHITSGEEVASSGCLGLYQGDTTVIPDFYNDVVISNGNGIPSSYFYSKPDNGTGKQWTAYTAVAYLKASTDYTVNGTNASYPINASHAYLQIGKQGTNTYLFDADKGYALLAFTPERSGWYTIDAGILYEDGGWGLVGAFLCPDGNQEPFLSGTMAYLTKGNKYYIRYVPTIWGWKQETFQARIDQPDFALLEVDTPTALSNDGYSDTPDDWLSFTPSVSGRYTFTSVCTNYTGGDFPVGLTNLSLYGDSRQPIAHQDAEDVVESLSISCNLIGNKTYYLQTGRFNDYDFNIMCSATVTAKLDRPAGHVAKITSRYPANGNSQVNSEDTSAKPKFQITFDREISDTQRRWYADVDLTSSGAFTVHRMSDDEVVYKPTQYSSGDFQLTYDKKTLSVKPINYSNFMDPGTEYYITMEEGFVTLIDGTTNPEIKKGDWTFTTSGDTPFIFECKQPNVTMIRGTAVEKNFTLYPSNLSAGWNSSNSNVVTVDDHGKITAVGEGNATVTGIATNESGQQKTIHYNVTVNTDVSVKFNRAAFFLKDGSDASLTCTVRPKGTMVSLSSSNPDVLAVPATASSERVQLTAKKSGFAVITATVTVGNVTRSADCLVTVISNSEAISRAFVDEALKYVGMDEGKFESAVGKRVNNNAWCADFVSICAQRQGLSSIIPYSSGSYNIVTGVINHGGKKIEKRDAAEEAQVGDIVYLGGYGHVGIVCGKDANDIYVVHGNWHGSQRTGPIVCAPKGYGVGDCPLKGSLCGKFPADGSVRYGQSVELLARPDWSKGAGVSHAKVTLTFRCPIDVCVAYDGEVLDSATGQLEASFGKMEVNETDESIVIIMDDTYDVDVTITSRGQGEMDVTATFEDEVGSVSTRVFSDVPIMESTVGKLYARDSVSDTSLEIYNGEEFVEAWTAGDGETAADRDEELTDWLINGEPQISEGTMTLSSSEVSVKVGETSSVTVAVTGYEGLNVYAISEDTGIVTTSAKDQTISITGVSEGTSSVYVIMSAAGVTTLEDAKNNPSMQELKVTVSKSSGGSSSGSGGGSSGGGSTTRTPSASVGGDGKGGKVDVDKKGNVIITPDEGYQVAKITVNGKDVEIPADGKLTGLKRTDKVVVIFEKIPASVPASTPISERFTDVKPGAWYEKAIQYVVDNGLFNGTSENTFSPGETMTRGMLATVLYRLAKEPDGTYSASFHDVGGGTWYTEAVYWAADCNIVGGYANGNFGPNDPVTREQLAVMLWRYAGRAGSSRSLDDFSDGGETSSWAVDALKWAAEQGIVTGKGSGILDPKGNATRAEVAAILMRYLENT